MNMGEGGGSRWEGEGEIILVIPIIKWGSSDAGASPYIAPNIHSASMHLVLRGRGKARWRNTYI